MAVEHLRSWRHLINPHGIFLPMLDKAETKLLRNPDSICLMCREMRRHISIFSFRSSINPNPDQELAVAS